MTSYYDVLAVGPDAGFEEVRRAYHRQAQRFHPDRYAESPEEQRRQAEAEMKALNEAWNTLRNSEARRRYDTELGLLDADDEDEAVGEEDLWAEGERPRPSPLRRTGVRLAIVLMILAGLVASAIAVLPPADDHSARWSATATAELRSAAIAAGMPAPQADCFVRTIATRYRPSDDVDRAVIQQVADDCR
jgi:hypothetical protein